MPVLSSEYFRNELLRLEKEARQYLEDMKGTSFGPKGIHHGEAIAQATIAMRHIEDARMRYGKVIQYLGDGESIFDKK